MDIPHSTSNSSGSTIFFLSDYGLNDEFVGVVHAVVRRIAPLTRVVDLTHGITPFDVRSGSFALARAIPYVGSGVVLAIVDPGVGSDRRGVVLEVVGSSGSRHFVGPDNGLLMAAARSCGKISRVVVLDGGDRDRSATFDGRDLFAPAAAMISIGADLSELGSLETPDSLVTLPPPVVDVGSLRDGRKFLRTEVTWIDRFGNVQLSAVPALLSDTPDGVSLVEFDRRLSETREPEINLVRARTFCDLKPGELGLIDDSSGHLAIVSSESSAAGELSILPGQLVTLAY